MRFPRMTARRVCVSVATVAVLTVVGSFWCVWRLLPRFSVRFGPGTVVVGFRFPVEPAYQGLVLPPARPITDDIKYFPPGPDFPWDTKAAKLAKIFFSADFAVFAFPLIRFDIRRVDFDRHRLPNQVHRQHETSLRRVFAQ